MSARREPTLADVAQVAGVSLTTVSRVLNNRGYLSQETKDRVAKAIAELNYRPNQVARALHGKSTHTIGVIVPTVALPFFGRAGGRDRERPCGPRLSDPCMQFHGPGGP